VKEEGVVESGVSRMVCGRGGKEGGGGILNSDGRRSGSGDVGRNNAGVDGHAGMVNGTLHCAAWEIRQVNNVV
jgi:hypothetical protein